MLCGSQINAILRKDKAVCPICLFLVFIQFYLFIAEKMAKVISQETFDGVVLENVTEFDMSIEDAVADAVKEFESQVSDGLLVLSRYFLYGIDYCIILYFI